MIGIGPAAPPLFPKYIPTPGEVKTMIKRAVEKMDSATVWSNYLYRKNYLRPAEHELQQAIIFQKINPFVLFPVKTEDGRYWYLCSIDGDVHLEQRDENGFRSSEVANYYGKTDLSFPISLNDVNEIENIIKSKLTPLRAES